MRALKRSFSPATDLYLKTSKLERKLILKLHQITSARIGAPQTTYDAAVAGLSVREGENSETVEVKRQYLTNRGRRDIITVTDSGIRWKSRAMTHKNLYRWPMDHTTPWENMN